jgi:hypothetical protein
VIKDISFASPTVGYIAAELGDPLRDEQARLGSRRQHLLGRRRPLLLEQRRTDVEPRPELRRGRLDACDHWSPGPGHPSLQAWCAGYDSSFAGKVYTLKLSASSG